jgi:hypothetical protein
VCYSEEPEQKVHEDLTYIKLPLMSLLVPCRILLLQTRHFVVISFFRLSLCRARDEITKIEKSHHFVVLSFVLFHFFFIAFPSSGNQSKTRNYDYVTSLSHFRSAGRQANSCILHKMSYFCVLFCGPRSENTTWHKSATILAIYHEPGVYNI